MMQEQEKPTEVVEKAPPLPQQPMLNSNVEWTTTEKNGGVGFEVKLKAPQMPIADLKQEEDYEFDAENLHEEFKYHKWENECTYEGMWRGHRRHG